MPANGSEEQGHAPGIDGQSGMLGPGMSAGQGFGMGRFGISAGQGRCITGRPGMGAGQGLCMGRFGISAGQGRCIMGRPGAGREQGFSGIGHCDVFWLQPQSDGV